MVEKKYYWLKLQHDFFKSLRIKKLRRLAGGDTYTIIYLKMQLLSLKNDGYLEYKGIFGSFEEELAEEIDEDLENIQVTVQYLLSVGLLEQADNTYLLPYVPVNTGSETATAERMRRMRDKKSVTMLQDGYAPVTACYTEKEIEKEKEIEIEEEIDKEKKRKENKKEKTLSPSETLFCDYPSLLEAFKEFKEFRKKIRKPITSDSSENRIITTLVNLATVNGAMDVELAVKILNQSVDKGWQGLFPIKNGASRNASDWSDA